MSKTHCALCNSSADGLWGCTVHCIPQHCGRAATSGQQAALGSEPALLHCLPFTSYSCNELSYRHQFSNSFHQTTGASHCGSAILPMCRQYSSSTAQPLLLGLKRAELNPPSPFRQSTRSEGAIENNQAKPKSSSKNLS